MNATMLVQQVAAEHRRDLITQAEHSRLVGRRPSTGGIRLARWVATLGTALGRTNAIDVAAPPVLATRPTVDAGSARKLRAA